MNSLPDWIQSVIVVIAMVGAAVSVYVALETRVEVMAVRVMSIDSEVGKLRLKLDSLGKDAQLVSVRSLENKLTISHIVKGYDELNVALKDLTKATQQLSIDIKTK